MKRGVFLLGLKNIKSIYISLKHIHSITELYTFANLQRTPIYNDFDLIHFNQLGQNTQTMMPPHRRNFHTIIFFKDQKTGQVNINNQKHQALTNTVLFQGTSHLFSFVRDPEVEGTIVLFSKSFLLPYITDPTLSFPFFNILNHNLFHLSNQEQQAFQQILVTMSSEKHHMPVIKPLLIALLEKSGLLYNTYSKEEKFLSKKTLLTRRYKNLVNNHFVTHKTVDYYASLLHITPNYLNEVVKSETGVSAKKHITERVLLEAQNLLLYARLDISEISHLLQFSEPTHFSKFFKKETGLTPKAYQENQQKP